LLQNKEGEYGYGGELTFEGPRYAAPGSADYPGPQAKLAPGEGIYSGLNSGDTLTSAENIRYGVLVPDPGNRETGTAEFNNLSFNAGNHLLTFNIATDVTRYAYVDEYDYASGSVGTRPASSPAAASLSSGAGGRALTGDSPPKPELYQWDGIRYFRERDKNREAPEGP
jgi:hypothetical protein